MYGLIVTLAFSFLVVSITYFVAGFLSAKGDKTDDKLIPYASGEKLPSEKIRINVENFFIYVAAFMIFDILAVAFVSFMGASGILPVIYTCVVLAISLIFVWMVKTQVGGTS